MRRYLGWEPAEVTSFEYDDEGRVARAVTVREPEFSAWDRALFLDQWRRDKEPRSSTGWPLSEATDASNQFAFKAAAPTRDYSAQALHIAQEQYKKKNPNADMGSLLWRVEKND